MLGQPSPCSGGRGRTLEGHIALVDFGEHGLGDGGEFFGAALDGEAIDGAEDDSAGGDRLDQQLFEHALGFTGDGGSDAVAAEHADGDRVELGVVGWLARGFDQVDSRLLSLEQRAEVFLGLFDRLKFRHVGSSSG